MRKGYLLRRQTAKARMNLPICAVSPEPLLFVHTIKGVRGSFRQRATSLTLLSGWRIWRISNHTMLRSLFLWDGSVTVSLFQFIPSGYAIHLEQLMIPGASRPASGNAKHMLRKSCFNLPAPNENKRSSKNRPDSSTLRSNSIDIPGFMRQESGVAQTLITVDESGNTLLQPIGGGTGRPRGVSPRPKIAFEPPRWSLLFKWAPSSEFVSSSIPSWQILTAHAQPFREARDLAFCLKVPLDSLLIWASSECSGETARMHRLAWTFAARIGYKYQIRLTRSKYLCIMCF